MNRTEKEREELIKICQRMEKWFNDLKAKGLFKEFKTYEEWRKAKGHDFAK